MNLRTSPAFKVCPKCGTRWNSRASFLKDAEVVLLGFRSGAGGPTSGHFLFHHRQCGNDLAIRLPPFADLTKKPVVWKSKCSAGISTPFCLATGSQVPCQMECICEFVADVLHAIRQVPKPNRVSG